MQSNWLLQVTEYCSLPFRVDCTCLDTEPAPNDPVLQNIGLVPRLDPEFRVKVLSGSLVVAIGCDVAVRLANGLSSFDCVDIIKTSIKICPIKSLKLEKTKSKKKKEKNLTISVANHLVLR